MNQVDPLVQTADILFGVIASGFAVLAGARGALRFLRRPNLACGVPPFRYEGIPTSRIGRNSVAHQYEYRSLCLGRRLNGNPESLSAREREAILDDRYRCRSLRPDAGVQKLPFILVNSGRRGAYNYLASISFLDRRVRVLDVAAESLDCLLFSSDTKQLETPLTSGSVVDQSIVDAYDLGAASNVGDMVFVWGNLDAQMHEMVLVTVDIDAGCEDFVVTFSIDCSDGWLKARTFIQGFRVK